MFTALIIAAAMLQSAQLPPSEPPPPETMESLQADTDPAGRMTVPVYINDKGPFPFAVDTAADHSVISDSLARVLALPPGPARTLHDIAGAEKVDTAIVTRLRVGSREISGLAAPMLVRANLGAVGMLGIDGLADQRIIMDFKANQMSVQRSPPHRYVDEPGTIVVRGRRRFGQLILVDAHFRGRKVYVIVDSGSQTSIGNAAFRHLVDRKLTVDAGLVVVVGVSGRSASADVLVLPEMQLSGITMRHLPVAFAEIHTFTVFGVANQPAMLLGMDALRSFESVSVDFTQKLARFRVKQGG